ncbi:MAG: ABC transporter ATP-binding protein, partial [Anaerolineaceae bacterium]
MLVVSHLSKTFNLQTLFNGITFSINPAERVDLIGP